MNKTILKSKMSLALMLFFFVLSFPGMQAQEFTLIPKPQELVSSEAEFSLNKNEPLWTGSP